MLNEKYNKYRLDLNEGLKNGEIENLNELNRKLLKHSNSNQHKHIEIELKLIKIYFNLQKFEELNDNVLEGDDYLNNFYQGLKVVNGVGIRDSEYDLKSIAKTELNPLNDNTVGTSLSNLNDKFNLMKLYRKPSPLIDSDISFIMNSQDDKLKDEIILNNLDKVTDNNKQCLLNYSINHSNNLNIHLSYYFNLVNKPVQINDISSLVNNISITTTLIQSQFKFLALNDLLEQFKKIYFEIYLKSDKNLDLFKILLKSFKKFQLLSINDLQIYELLFKLTSSFDQFKEYSVRNLINYNQLFKTFYKLKEVELINRSDYISIIYDGIKFVLHNELWELSGSLFEDLEYVINNENINETNESSKYYKYLHLKSLIEYYKGLYLIDEKERIEDFNKSLELIKKCLEYNERDVESLKLYNQLQYELIEIEESIKGLKKLIEINEYDWKSYYNLSNLLTITKLEDGLKLIEVGIEHSKNFKQLNNIKSVNEGYDIFKMHLMKSIIIFKLKGPLESLEEQKLLFNLFSIYIFKSKSFNDEVNKIILENENAVDGNIKDDVYDEMNNYPLKVSSSESALHNLSLSNNNINNVNSNSSQTSSSKSSILKRHSRFHLPHLPNRFKHHRQSQSPNQHLQIPKTTSMMAKSKPNSIKSSKSTNVNNNNNNNNNTINSISTINTNNTLNDTNNENEIINIYDNLELNLLSQLWILSSQCFRSLNNLEESENCLNIIENLHNNDQYTVYLIEKSNYYKQKNDIDTSKFLLNYAYFLSETNNNKLLIELLLNITEFENNGNLTIILNNLEIIKNKSHYITRNYSDLWYYLSLIIKKLKQNNNSSNNNSYKVKELIIKALEIESSTGVILDGLI